MQTTLLIGFGVFVIVTTSVLARRDLLAMRFVIAWGVIGVIIAATGPLAGALAPVVERIGMTPTGLLLGIVSAVLLAVCLQLSFDASATRRKVQDLAEANALVRTELEALRASMAPGTDTGPANEEPARPTVVQLP